MRRGEERGGVCGGGGSVELSGKSYFRMLAILEYAIPATKRVDETDSAVVF